MTDTPKRSITLTARYVDIVALFRSAADHGRKEPIHALRIEPHPAGGVLISATNGHIFGAIHDVDGATNGTWNCPVPASVLAKIRRADADAWLRFEGDRVAVVPASARHKKFKPKDATLAKAEAEGWPDFKRLLNPDMVPAVRTSFYGGRNFMATSFDAKYLGIFAEVGARAGKMGRGNFYGKHNLVIYPGSPSHIRIASLPEFFGMIMPYTNDEHMDAVMPDWMSALAPKRPAPAAVAAAPAAPTTEPAVPPLRGWRRALSWLRFTTNTTANVAA